jgi:hypothetical protein
MAFLHKLQAWLDQILKNDVYEVQGADIVCCTGWRSRRRLSISAIRAWQVHPEMGFDIVMIETEDGRQIRWIDRYDDLIAILRRVAASKEVHA